ncbi:MAG TPA: four helix bundle protein [Anaerolineae bacterium]|nr:four helix bundle protein [Anaerolineae bacterium]
MGAFSYEEWLAQVPESIKKDPLWNFQVYPKALLLADLAWEDTGRMIKDDRGRAIANQLIRSVGSICANLEEGHGRGFGKENAYFQRVALGSARESRGWYYRARHLLDPQVSQHRIKLLDEIIAALVLSSKGQRQYRKR